MINSENIQNIITGKLHTKIKWRHKFESQKSHYKKRYNLKLYGKSGIFVYIYSVFFKKAKQNSFFDLVGFLSYTLLCKSFILSISSGWFFSFRLEVSIVFSLEKVSVFEINTLKYNIHSKMMRRNDYWWMIMSTIQNIPQFFTGHN